MTLISIGITCFNAEKTISKAIESAINQEWKNKEVIIVDDCSTDRSIDIIKKYSSSYNIILIEHKNNLGPAGSRNSIIRNSNGDYIAFFDDDDFSKSNRLEIQFKKIKHYEKILKTDLIACYASGVRCYSNGYQLELNSISSMNSKPLTNKLIPNYLLLNIKKRNYFYGSGIPSCALMAKKTTFDKLNGYDESFRRIEDADFAIRLSQIGGYFVGTKEKLYIQYSTTGLDKTYKKNLEAEQYIVKKHKYFFKSNKDFYHALNWPLLRYHHFNKSYLRFIFLFIKIFLNKPIFSIIHILNSGPKRLIHEIKMKNN